MELASGSSIRHEACGGWPQNRLPAIATCRPKDPPDEEAAPQYRAVGPARCSEPGLRPGRTVARWQDERPHPPHLTLAGSPAFHRSHARSVRRSHGIDGWRDPAHPRTWNDGARFTRPPGTWRLTRASPREL